MQIFPDGFVVTVDVTCHMMIFEHSSAAQSLILSFMKSLCLSCRVKQANLGNLVNVDLSGLR